MRRRLYRLNRLIRRPVGVTLSVCLIAASSLAFASTASGAPTSEPYGIWDSSDSPNSSADSETTPVELGVKFTTAADGWISAIRYYKSAESAGSTVGTLWTSSGQVMAKADFDSRSGEGWKTAELDDPVAVKSGSTYVASYTAPKGRYAGDQFSLGGGKRVVTGDLTAIAGVFSYGLGFPTSTWNESNYYADVVFESTDNAAPGLTSSPPTVTSTRVTTPTTVTPTSVTTPPIVTTTTSLSTSRLSTPAPTPTSATPATSTRTSTSSPSSSTPTPSTPTTTGQTPMTGTTECASRPSVCGFPDASNSGMPAGTTLRSVPGQLTSGPGWHYDSRGWIAIDGDGAVLEGISTTASIDVTSDNVTITNSRIVVAGESWGIATRHTSNVTIQSNDILGPAKTGTTRLMVGIKDIYGDSVNLKVIDNDISFTSTGVQIESGTIQDNFIHDLGYVSGDHLNGITSNGGSSSLVIRHNTVFNDSPQTDAISLFQDFGPQRNRTIDNNLLAGGGYTLYSGANPGKESTATGITVTNNRFARIYYANSGYYGPSTAYTSGGGNTWSGNVWDDSGKVLSP